MERSQATQFRWRVAVSVPVSVQRGPAPSVSFLNILSTKRSGHHAFVDWLQDGLGGGSTFANNIVLGRDLGAEIERKLDRQVLQPGGGLEPGHYLLNFEGVTPRGFDAVQRAQFNLGAAVRTVLFLRDPLNTLASLLHRKQLPALHIVMLLRQMLALRGWLERHQQGRGGIDLVLYNHWIASADYRARIAHRLGLRPVGWIRREARTGSASSFGDLADFGPAAAPALANRWQAYRGDRLFNAILTHPVMAGTFDRMLAGATHDCLGIGERSDDRLRHFRAVIADRRPHCRLDRVINALAATPEVFERIEAVDGRGKKGSLLAAHLGLAARLLAVSAGSAFANKLSSQPNFL